MQSLKALCSVDFFSVFDEKMGGGHMRPASPTVNWLCTKITDHFTAMLLFTDNLLVTYLKSCIRSFLQAHRKQQFDISQDGRCTVGVGYSEEKVGVLPSEVL